MYTDHESARRLARSRGGDSTPICRCRVLYLGSSVPHVTKDGLQGIQEPLRELYPDQGALGAKGIDSWLSVWSNGILLENVDENHKKVTRFFPIESLHYCAAVRYVLVPEKAPAGAAYQPRFLPLDSPFARAPNPNHPPLFACILRRTTGIKVLECHTFICKREMAANALVRCCFHAYADSAYAKHMDGGGSGSVYGTLRTTEVGTDTIERVEDWRRTTPAASTLSLHSTADQTPPGRAASADDLSVYNGDENHKIWAGGSRESTAEDVYGELGGSVRAGRPARPRQAVGAPPPPPPPTKEERPRKTAKDKAKRRSNGRDVRDEAGTWQRGPTGSLPRPPPAGHMLVPMTLPHRGGKGFRGPPLMSSPPPMLPSPPPMLPPPHPMYLHPVPRKPYQVTMEEPIYMPSARPLSPVSSYQPCHFPHEAYLMQHYATMDYTKRKPGKEKKNKNKNNQMPMPLIIPNGRHDGGDDWSELGMYPKKAKEEKANGKMSSMSLTSERRSEGSDSPFNTGMYRKKNKDKSGSSNGVGGSKDEHDEDSDESSFNTGIYKRKGHLNERAFSYSIRQEHRSRSYGSLANLKFAPLPVVPNGGAPPPPAAHYYGNKEEMKKEREIMQMMQDLDLSGDELERSEVPPSVYQAKQRNTKVRR